jgi:hypothetical protein
MKKTMTLQVFADPGHGWARFPLARLVDLGIADEITPYSYVRGRYAYLEQDCDLATLVKALYNRGYEVKYKTHHTDRTSKIRGYDRYQGVKVVEAINDPLDDFNYVGSRHHY